MYIHHYTHAMVYMAYKMKIYVFKLYIYIYLILSSNIICIYVHMYTSIHPHHGLHGLQNYNVCICIYIHISNVYMHTYV